MEETMEKSFGKKVAATVFIAISLVGAGAAVSSPAFAGDDNHPHQTNPHHK